MKNTYWFINSICFGTALLFIYAATSKLIEFQNFKLQIGQSPVIAAWAGVIVILIPTIEILLGILIMVARFRKFALWASFTVMAMFTVYIYLILNYSSYIPCSCGGILEKMTWTQHLYFNIIVTVAIAVAFLLEKKESNKIGL